MLSLQIKTQRHDNLFLHLSINYALHLIDLIPQGVLELFDDRPRLELR